MKETRDRMPLRWQSEGGIGGPPMSPRWHRRPADESQARLASGIAPIRPGRPSRSRHRTPTPLLRNFERAIKGTLRRCTVDAGCRVDDLPHHRTTIVADRQHGEREPRCQLFGPLNPERRVACSQY